ncbi:MAG: DUF6458 family protein [Micromonosporaceae bacterium]
MGIGASIFMICLGAIVTFGLRGYVPFLDWLDLDVVGWVMMVGGVIGLITTLVFLANNRRQTNTHVIERHHPGGPPQY